MVSLVQNEGQPGEAVLPLREGVVAIGRAPACGIHIPHPSLSRRHAEIELRDGRAVLTDLGSKNGTRVNGTSVVRCELQDGDVVQIGDVTMRFATAEAHAPIDSTIEPEMVLEVPPVTFTGLLGDTARGVLRLPATDAAQRAQDKLRILLKISQLLAARAPAADPAASEGACSSEIAHLLETIVDLVFQVLQVDRAALLLADERTGALEPRLARSAEGPIVGGPIYSRHIVDYVLSRGVAALFADAASDSRLDDSASVLAQCIRASMCVPLRSAERVIGVLYVDNLSAPHRFTEEDLEFLAAFANQAASAIENAALHRRLAADAQARAELALREKLLALGGMVAAIAHELKNPLHFIANFAAISGNLLDELGELGGGPGAPLTASAPPRLAPVPGTPGEAGEVLGLLRQNLQRIDEHARRASAMIERMQSHVRSAASAAEEVDLNGVVQQAIRLALRAARPRGVDFDIAVRTELDPALRPVQGLREELTRALVSVLDNALLALRDRRRAAGPGYAPELVVRTAARGEKAEVRVRDNGVGIAKEAAPRVYDPFFTTRPPGEGAGLGLSIGYAVVVEGHRGEMRIESAPGEFTEMRITLPTDHVETC